MERIVTDQFTYLAQIWQGVSIQTQLKQQTHFIRLHNYAKSSLSNSLRRNKPTFLHVFVRGL